MKNENSVKAYRENGYFVLKISEEEVLDLLDDSIKYDTIIQENKDKLLDYILEKVTEHDEFEEQFEFIFDMVIDDMIQIYLPEFINYFE